MVYVDELQTWPHATGPFRRGSCHLTADTRIELHEFAAKIGLLRVWFQDHRILPHYDLTPSRREMALRSGAHFFPIREQLKKRRVSQALHGFAIPEDDLP